MKRGILKLVAVILWTLACLRANSWAQVNSGSNGSDGAFTPTATNTVINLADHPTGIYQFTAVNIPAYVTVTFLPTLNDRVSPAMRRVYNLQRTLFVDRGQVAAGRVADRAVSVAAAFLGAASNRRQRLG